MCLFGEDRKNSKNKGPDAGRSLEFFPDNKKACGLELRKMT